MSWLIETVGDLRKMIEPFDDEMKITPLKIEYDFPAGEAATLEIEIYEDED